MVFQGMETSQLESVCVRMRAWFTSFHLTFPTFLLPHFSSLNQRKDVEGVVG